MTINKFKQIYKDNLSFSYCSASAYYHFEGIDTPEKFGANCYEQAKRLKDELFKNGIQAEYIDDLIVGRHRSLIFKSPEGDFYISSYLMHENPILLDNTCNIQIPTHPFIGTENSTLCVSKKDDILNVTKLWPNSYRKDTFRFNINNLINQDLSYEEHLTRVIHPEQETLSIRVIDFENIEVLHYIFDFIRNKTFTVSSQGRFYKGTKEFQEILKRIASIIGSSSEEIEDYIYGAYKIREKILKSMC